MRIQTKEGRVGRVALVVETYQREQRETEQIWVVVELKQLEGVLGMLQKASEQTQANVDETKKRCRLLMTNCSRMCLRYVQRPPVVQQSS
jgi:hypothetical protein